MSDVHQPSLQQLGCLLAEAPKTVVFVVGAGLSRPGGLPLWGALQDALRQEALVFINTQKRAAIDALHAGSDPWLLGDAVKDHIPQDRVMVSGSPDFLVRRFTLHDVIPIPR